MMKVADGAIPGVEPSGSARQLLVPALAITRLQPHRLTSRSLVTLMLVSGSGCGSITTEAVECQSSVVDVCGWGFGV